MGVLEVYDKMETKLSSGTIYNDENDGFMLHFWMIINNFPFFFLVYFCHY